ncbi:MAG: FHA domain-containing protein [Verrucomicrobia subdivision 3 bacterium]|nr:FHA domain-containing protein [Limisphaerales bacterium]
MARLIVHPDTPQARQITLKQGVNRLGRRDDNDFTIDDPSVSGAHCQVTISNGVARLQDLGSTNGTYVNGLPVTDANLEAGQSVRLGAVALRFEGDGEPGVARPAVETAAASPIRVNPVPAPAKAPLRISLSTIKEPVEPHVPAAQVEAPPELEVPIQEAVALPTNTPCRYHPKTLARWVCPTCHKAYCDLCVSARGTASGSQMFCRTCGVVAAPVRVTFEAPKELSFFKELPRAVAYPFRGTGVMILIVATLIFAALDFVSKGILGFGLKAIALGYLFSYVQNIINTTASGDERLPDLPGMDDVLSGFFSLVGVVLMSFGPAIVVAYLAIAQEMPAAGIALIPAVILGCVYFPMAFLAVAIKDTAMASNPLVVVPAILRVPLEYLVTVVLVGGVFVIRWVGDAISGGMGGQALRTESIPEMLLLFGLRALWAFISVYLLTVTMRILGLLYLTRRDRIGW